MRLIDILRRAIFPKVETAGLNGVEQTTPAPTASNSLSGMRVVDLKALARERGLRGYSKLNKSQLLDLLS
jgi:hypothetical protein